MRELFDWWQPHYLTIGIILLILFVFAKDNHDRLSGKTPPRLLHIPGREADLKQHPLAFKIIYVFISLLVAAIPYALIIGF